METTVYILTHDWYEGISESGSEVIGVYLLEGDAEKKRKER